MRGDNIWQWMVNGKIEQHAGHGGRRIELKVFGKVWGAAATVSARGAFSTLFFETGGAPAGQGFNLSRVYRFALMAAGIRSLSGRICLAYQEEARSLLHTTIDLFLETWGFHVSPSYPHMYCFLAWREI